MADSGRKLDDRTRQRIRKLVQEGRTRSEVARLLRVDRNTVARILKERGR